MSYALDMITRYYDKRDPSKTRTYYTHPDDLFKAKNRLELIGKCITPSWLGIKNITFEKEV